MFRALLAALAALVLIISPALAHAGIDSLTNSYRSSQGLAPISTSSTLTSLAQQRAVEIAQPGGWHHDFWWWGPSGCAGIGENLHYRVPAAADPAARSVNSWINSPAHHANLVGDWDFMGSAIYFAPNGGQYSVQLFGKDCGGSAPAPAPKPAPAPAPAPQPSTAPDPEPVVTVLPDTALPSK